jgi:lipopolysaccharide export system protein LptC
MARTATPREKILAILPIIAMAGLAGGSYYLLQRSLPPAPAARIILKQHVPDAFADQFTVSLLNDSGVTQYRLNAASMVHYADDGSSNFTLPAVRAFAPGKPDLTGLAESGTLNNDQSIIDLYRNARLLQAASGTDPAMEADSAHFRIDTDNDTIQSEQPVKLQYASSVMYGDSMHYDNVTRKLILTGKVHGTLESASGAAAAPFSRFPN